MNFYLQDDIGVEYKANWCRRNADKMCPMDAYHIQQCALPRSAEWPQKVSHYQIIKNHIKACHWD